MSFWIELHCDRQTSHICDSTTTNSPGLLSQNTRPQLLYAIKELKTRARMTGWKNVGTGWVCPECDGPCRCIHCKEGKKGKNPLAGASGEVTFESIMGFMKRQR